MENTLEITKVNPAEFGLNENEGLTIESAFMPKIVERDALKQAYEHLITQELTIQLSAAASTLRKKLVKVRTGIAEVHKTQKAYFLSGGRFADSIKNKETLPIEQMEEKLQAIENHFENLEKERIANLQLSRQAEVEIYGVVAVPSLGSMQDDVWNNYILGVKLAYEAKIKAEKEAEEQRVLAEKAEAERKESERKENERIRIENERLKKEAEEKEATLKAEREAQAKALQAEKDKAESERLATEKKAKIERETRETLERKAQAERNAELKAETEKRLKAEAELQAKRDAEAKAEKEKIAAEKKAAKAPDKVKLIKWVDDISFIEVNVSTPEAVQVAQSIDAKFKAFKDWAKTQIETL